MPSLRIDADALVFHFPEVHGDASLHMEFQRTLRIRDDDKEHPLPPGLGSFPLRNADGYASTIPAKWAERGGAMLPTYQSEALWIAFGGGAYPFAVKIATGNVCALTGEISKPGLARDPQNYLVVPGQPWLDGYDVGGDQLRQFVAAPLQDEASVEKQLTGKASEGGMQIEVRPMTAEAWKKHEPDVKLRGSMVFDDVASAGGELEMGFAAGGRMRQEIYADECGPEEWSGAVISCDLWVCNSLAWRAITKEMPPTAPPEPEDYRKAGLPWFDYFDDKKHVTGSANLAALKSYKQGNESVNFSPEKIIEIRKQAGMREYDVRMRGNN